MEIFKEIKEIQALQNSGEKDSRLLVLNSEFEYGDIGQNLELFEKACMFEEM